VANRIYTIEDITLQGWEDEKGQPKTIRIFPLAIKKFRKLAEILDKFSKEEYKDVAFIDVLMEGAAFCMQTFCPELSDANILSDYLDWPTLEHILEIAGGIKLNDPNLQAAMAATAGKN